MSRVVNKYFLLPAPSAPPTHINTYNVTSFNITVQWRPVDCIHRNGNITGYSVRYGVHNSVNKQVVDVMGGATTETTITGLNATTNYSIEVAAVNSAGTGIFSATIFVVTQGIVFTHCFKPLNNTFIKCGIAIFGSCSVSA